MIMQLEETKSYPYNEWLMAKKVVNMELTHLDALDKKQQRFIIEILR